MKEIGTSSNKNCNREFSGEEQALIDRMFNLLGRRWALIAGRIPGSTPEEIEHYCTSSGCKKPIKVKASYVGNQTKPGQRQMATRPQFLAMQKQIVQPAVADKRKAVEQHVESWSRKDAKRKKMNSKSQENGGAREAARKLSYGQLVNMWSTARNRMDIWFSELENRLAQLLKEESELERLQHNAFVLGSAIAELEKTQVILNAAHREELEKAVANMELKMEKANNYLHELSKFVQVHAEECAYFAVKLKEWSLTR